MEDKDTVKSDDSSQAENNSGKKTKKRILRNTFLTGVFATLPLVATVYIFKILYNVITDNLGPVIRSVASLNHVEISEAFIGISSVAVFIIAIFSVGVLIKLYIGKVLIMILEKVVSVIPFARVIYNLIKQMVDSINSSSNNFEKLVLVDFPRQGFYSIGFVVRDTQESLSLHANISECYNVFVPTAPNPTSGYVAIIPKKDCIDLPYSIDVGIKFILTVGLMNFSKEEQAVEAFKSMENDGK